EHAVGVLIHNGGQLARADHVGVEDQLVAALHDLHDAHPGGGHAHQRNVYQPLHALGRAAVTVDELVQYIFGVRGGLDGGDALVGFDAPGGVGDVIFRQVSVDGSIHQAVALVGGGGFAACRGNGLTQHLHIQVVAHGFH